MKTFFKITALAVIMVLAVLSCAPEVEVTARDSGEINAQFNPEQIGASYTVPDLPTIRSISTFGGLSTPQIDNTAKEEHHREAVIKFPKQADVLRKSDSDMQSALESFLSFHEYTDAPTPAPLAADFSTLNTDKITYKFVRRGAGLITDDDIDDSDNNKITIRFDKVPNVRRFVAKFNEKYTCNNGYRHNVDTSKSGAVIYEDYYYTVTTYGEGPTLPAYNFTAPGHKNWSITLANITGVNNAAPTERTFPVLSNVNISLSGGTSTDPTAEQNAARKEIIDGWKDKFKLQKLDGKTWVEDTAPIRWLDNTTTPTQAVAGLYVTFTPADRTVYRFIMSDAENLTTDKEFYGQKQKVRVGNEDDDMKASYYRNTVTGKGDIFWNYTDTAYNYFSRNYSNTVTFTKFTKVTSDSKGKNVVLNFVVTNLDWPEVPKTPHYLKEMTLADFNKNCKFVYSLGGTALNNIADLKAATDLAFIKVVDIKYGNSPNPDGVAGKFDQITVTLDPNYKFGSGGTKYLLISPGFTYTSDKIIFGSYDNWDFELDGQRYWDLYKISYTGDTDVTGF